MKKITDINSLYIEDYELEKRHTKELLSIQKKLRKIGYIYSSHKYINKENENQANKLQAILKENVKKELNTREHIPNKLEAKKIRQEKGKRK